MTAVIVVTPRGTAGHFHIMGVTSTNMKSRIKDKKIIRFVVAIAGILLLALAAFAYQASAIPRSRLLNPDELVKHTAVHSSLPWCASQACCIDCKGNGKVMPSKNLLYNAYLACLALYLLLTVYFSL